jgi:hypothetical protein
MNIDPITVLTACHTTALMLLILITLVAPTFTGAIFAAEVLLKVTWLIKFGIRLCRTPESRPPYRSLWRCVLVDELWECLA